jgi:tetratricopeptide (TPR) repeat protein
MWIASRDYDKAMPPLRKAAELHDNGDLYVRIAELSLRNEDWKGAVEALKRAFAKGNLRDPGSSQLLMGIALFSQQDTREARAAFQKATGYPKVRSQAESWIRHIDSTQS